MIRLLVLIFSLAGPVTAGERLIETPDGDEIPVSVLAGDGERVVVWLPAEFGGSDRRTALARTLADNGIEVWMPDLHAAWFLPVGRYSLNDVDPAAVSEIIAAATETGKQVFLISEGRVTALTLNAVRHWQLQADETASLRGLLTFGPNLFVRTPQGGESAQYLPVTAASNLPVYVLQPEESGAFWRVGRLVQELEKGGSSVFLHRLPQVSDGFHVRGQYSDAEQAMTVRLPDMLANAMDLLDTLGGAPANPAPIAAGASAPEKPGGSDLLRPYPAERHAPALVLPTLRGADIDLAALKGKVVLVNFWATWCPPCVEEIPSLQRLYKRLQPQGLEILAVDVGESVEIMEAFLQDKPIDFPVLMDSDGEALRRWGIYAFPTTLVLDREHRIRYAVFGAFDWSSDEVIDALMPLLHAGD